MNSLEKMLEEDKGDMSLKKVLNLSINQIFPMQFAFDRSSFGPGLQ